MDFKIFIYHHLYRTEAIKAISTILQCCFDKNIQVFCLKDQYDILINHVDNRTLSNYLNIHAESTTEYNAIISIGGDGTLLRASKIAYKFNTPLIGINAGRLGFLAEGDLENIDFLISLIYSKQYHISEVYPIGAYYNNRRLGWGINEVTIEKAHKVSVIEVSVEVNGIKLFDMYCDGLICATQIGSTGYAFSAGGPIVWPSLECLIIIPINPHTINNRPCILPNSKDVIIKLPKQRYNAFLCFDGFQYIDLEKEAKIYIRKENKPLQIIRSKEFNFAHRLVNKLRQDPYGWSAYYEKNNKN